MDNEKKEETKKDDFMIDIKQLVEDLTNTKNTNKEYETKIKEFEEKVNLLEKEKTDMITKNKELSDSNAKLYLQVAQSIVTPNDNKQEENKKDDTLSVQDLVNKLQF